MLSILLVLVMFRYECKMKLYEMLQLMGDEYVGVFMAIRTVTQRSCSYFVDRADELWAIMDMEYPELISEWETVCSTHLTSECTHTFCSNVGHTEIGLNMYSMVPI